MPMSNHKVRIPAWPQMFWMEQFEFFEMCMKARQCCERICDPNVDEVTEFADRGMI